VKVVKLNKDQDIAAVIQVIRDLKDREVVFELEKGSPLLANSTNLKLMKKTGEVMGKKVRVRTDDQMGRVLAMKAEILEGGAESPKPVRPTVSKVRRSDVKPRFSDIVRPRSGVPVMPPVKAPAAESSYIKSAQNKFLTNAKADGEAPGRSGSNFSKYFIIAVVVLVLVVFGLAVLLPTADITVYARSEPITRDADIAIDKSVIAVDAEKAIIPGVIVARDVSQTRSFPTTGSKNVGTKATGNIQLYNFTKNTLTLKASTTALLVSGKKFVFGKDVTGLRPTATIGTGADAEIDKSSLIPLVAIVSEQAGADYNIAGNTKFNIVNAALGNQNVYAINPEAFTGGTTKTIKIVNQQDLDSAAASMTNTIANQAEKDLNSEHSTTDEKMLPTAVAKEVLAKTSNKTAGDEAASFDMTMIAKVSGLSYKESNVKALILRKIQSVLSDDKYILPDATDKVTASFKSLDLPNGKGVLAAHYETIVAYKVNTSNISQLLAGKTAEEIKGILLAKPEIDRVDVQFSPFFVNKAPKLNGKIYIHTMLSQGQ
jgi:hypothetical protein